MCLPECPIRLFLKGTVYEIDPLRCTECVGFYDAPTCKAVCPIDCIKQDPAHIENKEQLLEKFKRPEFNWLILFLKPFEDQS